MKKLFFTALIVLGLGWYAIDRLLDFGSETRAFPAPLITLDTAAVTAVILRREPELSFVREATGWIASNGRLHLVADPGRMQDLLVVLREIRAEALAAAGAGEETGFGVEEPEGIRVQVYAGEALVEDFTLGRFHYQADRRRNITYLRLTGQHEVYVVDGAATLPLRGRFDDYRRRDLLRLPPAATVTALHYQKGDSLFRFSRRAGAWQGNGGTPIDSAEAAAYCKRLYHLRGDAFADDFDELMAQHLLHQTLTVYSPDLPAPIHLFCYRDSTREPPFILRSSRRPEVFFASDSNGLYRQLFEAPERWRSLEAAK